MPNRSANITRLLSESKKLRRSIKIEQDSINVAERTIFISWGSEEPVERWGFVEILDFKKTSVQMTRLNTNAPFLLNHDTDDQIGVVTKAWIEDKRGRASIKFSSNKNKNGLDIFQDVVDGIRTLVSVGYAVYEAVTESVKDGMETVRCMDWEPYELSLVPIPADITVGVGRNAEQFQPNNGENRNMLEPVVPAVVAPTPVTPPSNPAPENRSQVTVSDASAAVSGERTRISEITALGNRAKLPIERINTAISEGWSADRMRQVIFEERFPTAQPVAASSPDIGMSEREKKRYSIVRAMNRLADKKPLDGLELEASNTVAKNSRREAQGFFVPTDVRATPLRDLADNPEEFHRAVRGMVSRALNADTATAGGYTIQESVLGDAMIELLRNKMVISKLGAMNLTGLVGDVAIPRQNGPAIAYWLGENDAVSETDQSIGQITLRPRRLAAQTAYSKQLLSQPSISVELFVRQDLMLILALAKDLAAIAGLGAAGQPLGIINTTGVGSVTFSGATTWPKVVSFETILGQANADRGQIGFLTTPGVKGSWKGILRATGALVNSSSFLWDNGKVNEYPAESTNQVPNNQVIFGNFNDLILADWDGLDVVVDPYTLAQNGQVRIVEMLMTDVAVRHPVSFVVSSDAGNQ